MEIKNKSNNLEKRLLKFTFKINVTVFALLWIIYCIISFGLSLFVFGGWVMYLTIPLSFLLYLTICVCGLIRVGMYTRKAKKWWLKFYPIIFIVLVLLPQILVALFNPINDCGDQECNYNPNFLISQLLGRQLNNNFSLIAIISFFVYVTGLIILFKKICDYNTISDNAQESQPLSTDWLSLVVFLAIVITMIGGLIRFVFYQMNYITKQDSHYSEMAQSTKNSTICHKISDQYLRNDCYSYIGIAQGDLTICDKIIGENLISKSAKNRCYVGVAGAKQDLAICNKIQHQAYQNDCYSIVAEAKQDVSICEKIQGQLQTMDKDKCYEAVGLAKKDASLCGKIEELSRKSACYRDVQK